MYQFIRKLLFCLPSEIAHDVSLNSLRLMSPLMTSSVPQAPVEVMGLRFPNPVGLAAGLDKNGDYINALAKCGFGFIEIGTVTPKPQHGNPKPRLFRLPQAQALINRMGFNNKGIDYCVERVTQAHFKGILGVNIGKNKATPLEKAVDDYLFCMNKVYHFANYITLNISSPNTPGLRQLQTADHLEALLLRLKQEQYFLQEAHKKHVPLVVKIAPDLSDDEIKQIAEILLNNHIDGVIATNTTVDHHAVQQLPHGKEQGSLSGAPLFEKSYHVVSQLHQALQDQIPIIALGGIMSADAANKMRAAGASLVQLYTGFIYHGPRLIYDIVNGLS